MQYPNPCIVGITGLEPATPSSRTTCATNCAKSRLPKLKRGLNLKASAKVQFFFIIKNFFAKKFAISKKNHTFALAIRKYDCFFIGKRWCHSSVGRAKD